MSGFVVAASTNTSTFTVGRRIWRTPTGPERWGWWAQGPKGLERGTAMSKAVAESRARRAMGVEL